MAADQPQALRRWHYRLPWYGWAAALSVIAVGVGLPYVAVSAVLGRPEHSTGDVLAAAGVSIVVCGMWVAMAASVVAAALFGQIALTADGVHWRSILTRCFVPWPEIVAVGEPSAWGGLSARYRRRPSLRLVAVQGYRDIPAQYVPGREVFEAIAQWGGLTETLRIGEREFRCRPGWSPQEFWREAGRSASGGVR